MPIKKISQISLIVFILVLSFGVIFISRYARNGQKPISSTAEESSAKPEYQPADNKVDVNQWTEFVHPSLQYSFRYPAEFKLEQRGRVGNIEDLVALNYSAAGKQITIIKFQLTNEVPQEKTVVSQTGKDNNNNEVLIYKLPFRDTKTLTVIGTVYPNIGSGFRFEEVIKQIAQTIKVL